MNISSTASQPAAGEQGRGKRRFRRRSAAAAPGVVVPLFQSLDDVAAAIRNELQLGDMAVFRGIEHVKRAGELLVAVKAYLPHGQFGRWIKKHFDFEWRTAQLYMKVAVNWAELESKAKNISHLTLMQAIRALAKDKSAEVHCGRPDNLSLFGPSEAPIPIGAPSPIAIARRRPDADYRCPDCGHEWSGDPRPADKAAAKTKRTAA